LVKNRAVFLDRDGVINIDKGYVFKIDDFIFTKNIFDLTRYYQDKGYIIIVVTNQSGIARGYYSEDQFNDLSIWMIEEFNKQGVRIEKVYHCPHHPDFDLDCECRKPKPGMILEAEQDFNIDLAVSIMIGDKETDLIAGQLAGVGNNFLIRDLNIEF
jgi:D-glycero-D-manno-heptose 1,7-bisphosphate phosphatase